MQNYHGARRQITLIYLDNAATSWPKPPQVAESMNRYMNICGGNPGRSGHKLSLEAGRVVYETRELVAELFSSPDPLRVILTNNATHALNIAIKGILKPGDKVVTTAVEHNSVMRPLRALESCGVEVVIAPCSTDGALDMSAFQNAVSSGAKLAVVNHASNVTGTLQDISKATEIAHKAGALILIDAAQAAGVMPINMQKMGIDLLAFTGHKGPLGPQGTGGLVIGENVDTSVMSTIMEGGTGSRSDSERQPEDLPDKYEAGTPNGVGIAGLGAGIKFVLDQGVDDIHRHYMELFRLIVDGLTSIPRVRVYGTKDAKNSVAVVSFTVDGLRVSDIGLRLDEEYEIMARVGLHCAPAAHRTASTFPEGTVRFAPGIFTTPSDIEQAIEAVRNIAQS